MTELIDRLEAAEEGSRELDLALIAALDVPAYGPASLYTTSLDAALTLVPEGWAIEDWMIWPGHPSSLRLLETELGREGKYWHSHPMRKFEAKAATPALALCAACLRAIKASDTPASHAGELEGGE